jgi:hypothetical protein
LIRPSANGLAGKVFRIGVSMRRLGLCHGVPPLALAFGLQAVPQEASTFQRGWWQCVD